jgi:hypothetical protein
LPCGNDPARALFRRGTPYEGEDVVYHATAAEQFFARCMCPVDLPGHLHLQTDNE